jgi:serine/threonine-protein kinase
LKETEPAAAEADDRNGSSWSAVKRRMRVPVPASDLYGLGHLFLFIMYAAFVPEEGQAERSWEEELPLPPSVTFFVRRLLGQDEPGWHSAAQCAQELDGLMAGLRREGIRN